MKQAARDAERIAQEKKTAADDAARKADYVGIGRGNEGRQLSERLKRLFTLRDPKDNVLRAIEFLQSAIDGRFSIIFGYRSGTITKRQNAFHLRDVTPYGWQVSPKTGKPNLKVMGWDNAVNRRNVEVLIKEGFITKKTAEEFMRTF